MKYIQEKIIIIGGVWLVILPYTGFPSSWKKVLTILTGIVFLYVGLLLYKKITAHERPKNSEIKTETFTETI